MGVEGERNCGEAVKLNFLSRAHPFTFGSIYYFKKYSRSVTIKSKSFANFSNNDTCIRLRMFVRHSNS
jgi:hypothetical protein